jgi:hypothetical protein
MLVVLSTGECNVFLTNSPSSDGQLWKYENLVVAAEEAKDADDIANAIDALIGDMVEVEQGLKDVPPPVFEDQDVDDFINQAVAQLCL